MFVNTPSCYVISFETRASRILFFYSACSLFLCFCVVWGIALQRLQADSSLCCDRDKRLLKLSDN